MAADNRFPIRCRFLSGSAAVHLVFPPSGCIDCKCDGWYRGCRHRLPAGFGRRHSKLRGSFANIGYKKRRFRAVFATKNPDISISIIKYKSSEHIIKCLDSVQRVSVDLDV